MRLIKLRIERVAVGLLMLPPGLGFGVAQARPELTVDLSANTNIATNPYQLAGNNTESGSVEVSAAPVLSERFATGSFQLSGRVSHEEFFNRYKSTQSYSIDASGQEQISAKLSGHANLGFDSSIYGANQLLFPGTDSGGLVDPNLPPVVDDITLSGLRERRVSYRAGVGLVMSPSPRDSVTVDANAFASRYPRATTTLSEYNYYGTTLGYQRQIDSRTSIGVQGSLGRTDYLGRSSGDATVFSPRLTASTKLDPRWSLSGSIGVSITRTNLALGQNTDTSLALSLTACRKGDRSNFCLTGSRAATPSAIDGVRVQTSIGANYNYRIDDKSDIGVTGNYSRSSRTLSGVAGPQEYVNTRVTYNRKLGQNIRGFVAAGYSDIFDGAASRRGNVEGSLGVTLQLGRPR